MAKTLITYFGTYGTTKKFAEGISELTEDVIALASMLNNKEKVHFILVLPMRAQ